jgi:hypothetical protein
MASFPRKINWFILQKNKRSSKESSWFGEQRHGTTQGFNFASNESKLVPRNLDSRPHLKWAKKRSSKESLWFGQQRCKLGSKTWCNSRIQFASNESKLVPRNLDSRTPSKVGPSIGIHFKCCSSINQVQLW